MNSYEANRAAQIAANKALIASLGLAAPKQVKRSSSVTSDEDSKVKSRPKVKKPKLEATRRSARIQDLPDPDDPNRRSSRLREALLSLPDDYTDEEEGSSSSQRRRKTDRYGRERLIKQLPAPIFPEPEDEELDYDPDYRAPLPSRDEGNSEYGRIRFSDTPHFTPNLTPSEMMRMGSFGGTYFRQFYSSVCRKDMPADFDEFPTEWYDGLDAEEYLSSQDYDPSLNKYRVKASQSIEEWERAGWIIKQDPRGWMQWYCRFYLGRRTPDDDRQIRRFLSAVGPRGRFKTSLVKKIAAAGGVEEWNNPDIAPILRQTLQHWGIIVTKEDMQEYMDL